MCGGGGGGSRGNEQGIGLEKFVADHCQGLEGEIKQIHHVQVLCRRLRT